MISLLFIAGLIQSPGSTTPIKIQKIQTVDIREQLDQERGSDLESNLNPQDNRRLELIPSGRETGKIINDIVEKTIEIRMEVETHGLNTNIVSEVGPRRKIKNGVVSKLNDQNWVSGLVGGKPEFRIYIDDHLFWVKDLLIAGGCNWDTNLYKLFNYVSPIKNNLFIKKNHT
ncbi:serine hydroxymethyltransferase 1 [Striga asiatica]|uniref:Serine hydroxymethyltransferase 1 n=1 Tax=Striga asiatica TaxID=4170 RepID=A0A5A7QC29_STRAF|nr:serine hydroxymethyltransferase 1 [Striga asiatica]